VFGLGVVGGSYSHGLVISNYAILWISDGVSKGEQGLSLVLDSWSFSGESLNSSILI
jgi:hypothetical protein